MAGVDQHRHGQDRRDDGSLGPAHPKHDPNIAPTAARNACLALEAFWRAQKRQCEALAQASLGLATLAADGVEAEDRRGRIPEQEGALPGPAERKGSLVQAGSAAPAE